MNEFRDIGPQPHSVNATTADQITQGLRFPPQQQILLYSSAMWEEFIEEWAYFCLKPLYVAVRRFTGAGDRGIDIAGFADAERLQGVWNCYQCKHYDQPLGPTTAWPEIGKILWHSFIGDYRAPRAYYFVAPRGTGTTLTALLADKSRLKKELFANWDKHCRKKITSTQEIALEREFLAHADGFDFGIFGTKTSLEVIDGHRSCPHHATRFGVGLPQRPPSPAPPDQIASTESNYVGQLLAAYADHTRKPVPDADALGTWPKLREHFWRQREAFYDAEGLRVFARDSVPPGAFEGLQDDIYNGVIDDHDADHPDGYRRVCAVTKAARDLQLTSNALLHRTKPRDRDGICQQLANEDRLRWTKPPPAVAVPRLSMVRWRPGCARLPCCARRIPGHSTFNG